MTDRDNNDRWDESANRKEVLDEDGTVDQKIKNRILKARERVDGREDSVFVEEPLDGDVHLLQSEKEQIWCTSVRQYLRAIEPLLKSDGIEQADYYYRQIPIVNEPVYPPDGEYPQGDTGDENPVYYRFSLFYREDVATREAIAAHDHARITRAFEPPEPKTIEINGLLDVLEADTVQKDWVITPNPDALPPQQYTVTPRIATPLKKRWLEKAVRIADEFLQEAGVGLEIGAAEDPHGRT